MWRVIYGYGENEEKISAEYLPEEYAILLPFLTAAVMKIYISDYVQIQGYQSFDFFGDTLKKFNRINRRSELMLFKSMGFYAEAVLKTAFHVEMQKGS